MRYSVAWLAVLNIIVATLGTGCATRHCVESYSTMPNEQVIRGDGELLQQLVEKRQAAAQALQALAEGSSERADLEFSIQAWEMAIRLIVQLQNLSRRDENAEQLTAQRELTTDIRCEARAWATGEEHIVSGRSGQAMLGYQRDLEAVFGERGRPTDSQLSAIVEGREIYMGPVEEEVEVPQNEEGTGPAGATEEAASGSSEGGENGSSSAVDDLLGAE